MTRLLLKLAPGEHIKAGNVEIRLMPKAKQAVRLVFNAPREVQIVRSDAVVIHPWIREPE